MWEIYVKHKGIRKTCRNLGKPVETGGQHVEPEKKKHFCKMQRPFFPDHALWGFVLTSFAAGKIQEIVNQVFKEKIKSNKNRFSQQPEKPKTF